MSMVKTGMMVGLCGLLMAHSDIYSEGQKSFEAPPEKSFWQTYGEPIKQAIPWVITVASILHYRGVANKNFMEGARAVYQHLGDEKGFRPTILGGNLEAVPVVKIGGDDDSDPRYRLCRQFLENSYQSFCALCKCSLSPVLKFETKSN